MNDNSINNNPETTNTYHATSNLNTAIENPEINMGSATGINIEENTNVQVNNQNPMNNNSIPTDQTQYNNSFGNPDQNINKTPDFTDYSSETDSNFYNTTDNNNYYSYEPILQEKKNNSNAMSEIIHSKEAKIMVLILFVLIIFLLIMPYIYDLFT